MRCGEFDFPNVNLVAVAASRQDFIRLVHGIVTCGIGIDIGSTIHIHICNSINISMTISMDIIIDVDIIDIVSNVDFGKKRDGVQRGWFPVAFRTIVPQNLRRFYLHFQLGMLLLLLHVLYCMAVWIDRYGLNEMNCIRNE